MTTDTAAPTFFDVVLTPHRSAGVQALRVVTVLLAIVWGVLGLVFVVVGAWPVTGFLGLEVVLLYGALRLNLRRGRGFETIRLTPRELTVARVDHWGRRRDWTFQPAWLQVRLDRAGTPESRLELHSHGRKLAVGGFLLPDEKSELAGALRQALAACQGGRAF